jgi:hypothetical protein
MTSAGHPFHFTELFLAEEPENLIDYPQAETHSVTQLVQGHFTI